MGNFDGFLTIAVYNDYTGRMSAFCAPRFRRNVSKTTLVETIDHLRCFVGKYGDEQSA
jgi:hypothetical protein